MMYNLRCLICKTLYGSPDSAFAHSKDTKHANFDVVCFEINTITQDGSLK